MKNKIFSVLFLLLCGVFFSCNNEVDGGGGNGTPSGPDMPVNDFSGNVFEGKMEDGTVFGKLTFSTDYSATLSVFGESHIEEVAEQHGLKVLAQMPIRPQMAGHVDEGTVEYIEADFLKHAADMVEKL